MPATYQNDFSLGEMSPKLLGRFNIEEYQKGCKTLKNFLVMQQGGAERTPGTKYIANNKTQTSKSILIPFIKSNSVAYSIELGQGYMRFFKNDGTQIYSGASPYEIASPANDIPWLWAELEDIQYCQDGENLLLFHENRRTVKLTRTSDTSWAAAYYAMYSDAAETTLMFNTAGNYPRTGTFFEGRLIVAFTANDRDAIWGSIVGNTDCFDTAAGGTIDDSDGWKIRFSSKFGSYGYWVSGEDKLYVGAESGVHIVTGIDDLITPANFIASRKKSPYGAYDSPPTYIGTALMYTQSNRKIVRGVTMGEQGQYSTNVLNILSDHIAGDGFLKQSAFQQNPNPIVWKIKENGQPVAFVVDVMNKIYAWCPQELEGVVESICIIPTSTGTREDQIWVMIKREIDGSTVRYVELYQPRDYGSDDKDACFLNSCVFYDESTKDFTAITKSATSTITFPTQFEEDIYIRISGVSDAEMPEVNDEVFVIKNETGGGPYTYDLYLSDGTTRLDTSGYTAAATSGTADKQYREIEGLDHLEGETISAIGDGAKVPDMTVSSGETTLDDFYGRVIAGKTYRSIIQPMPVPPIGRLGSAYRISLSLYRSMGGKTGDSLDDLYDLDYRGVFDMDSGPSLRTEVVDAEFSSEIDREISPYVVQDDPFPMNILFFKTDFSIGER